MFLEDLNIDVQIYQDEKKKPSATSMILLPLNQKNEQINQLLLKWTDTTNSVSQKDINEAAKRMFNEWTNMFPLYRLQRAFIDITDHGNVELYITFDAANIFSNTQIHNIKKHVPELLKNELKKVAKEATIIETERIQVTESNQLNHRVSLLQQQLEDAEKSQRRVELDWHDNLNNLKLENSELHMKLQQSKASELSQKEKLGQLMLKVEKQQRELDVVSTGQNEANNKYAEDYRKLKTEYDDLNFQLRKSTNDVLDKQREIKELEMTIQNHNQYVESLQADFEQVKKNYDTQLTQLINENDTLKTDVIRYQNNDLSTQQMVQGAQSELLTLKNKLTQLVLEKENLQEEWQQRHQKTKFENDELRAVIRENQTFENQTQQELIETTSNLTTQIERVKYLETENNLINHEWESRYQQLLSEKNDLSVGFEHTKQVELDRQNELLQLKERLTTQEQVVRQANLENEQMKRKWQERLSLLEQENQRIIQQSTIEKEQIAQAKQTEIQRLADRLAQQQELVNKMMTTQKDTQTSWQDHYQQLEDNYRKVREQSTDYEQQLSKLRQINQTLETRISNFEQSHTEVLVEEQSDDSTDVYQTPISFDDTTLVPVETDLSEDISREIEVLSQVAKEEDLIPEPIVETTSVTYEDEDTYSYDDEDEYYYEDEDDDYYYYEDDYDYDGDDEDDYDYDYEDDDAIGYDEETIVADVNELLDSDDEEEIIKLSKNDYQMVEEELESLKERWEEVSFDSPEKSEFKVWVEPKMKDFSRFYKKLDDNVTEPKLFSRKYKVEEDTWNKMRAYALISRHLENMLED